MVAAIVVLIVLVAMQLIVLGVSKDACSGSCSSAGHIVSARGHSDSIGSCGTGVGASGIGAITALMVVLVVIFY